MEILELWQSNYFHDFLLACKDIDVSSLHSLFLRIIPTTDVPQGSLAFQNHRKNPIVTLFEFHNNVCFHICSICMCVFIGYFLYLLLDLDYYYIYSFFVLLKTSSPSYVVQAFIAFDNLDKSFSYIQLNTYIYSGIATFHSKNGN